MKQKVKGRNVGTYETLNEVLVSLFRDVNDIEQKAIITSEFSDITNNDMHVIDAIGIDRPKNMSSIARELSVTVGTLTISVNSLVKKGYVVRNRSSEDRRVVFISLSEKGVKAYYHHKKFHEQMIDSVVKELTEEELEGLKEGSEKADHPDLDYEQKETGQKIPELLKGKEAVIFDLDGTLVDSMWMWKQIDIEYLGRFGYECPPQLQKKSKE